MLLHNTAGTLRNVSQESGPAFTRPLSARGLALGDFDNDGAVDVFISNNDSGPVLLRNSAAAGSHWLGLKLTGKKCNPDAVGARIRWQAGASSGA